VPDSPDHRGEPWFTKVYAVHYPDVVRYGIRRLADAHASAELAQEVFEIAWRRRADVPDNALPWLYGVARRLLANRWRHRRTHPPEQPLRSVETIAATDGYEPGAAAAIADLRTALARLPELDQEILRLVGWEQLTVAEAADVIGCTRTAAKVRLHRARRRLAALLTVTSPTRTSPPAPACR
jgi:RNA polymerase sigma-70 factor (ECF subfamily)